jgi:ABC-type branched-subunit amino acid transport system substrate-binding protein
MQEPPATEELKLPPFDPVATELPLISSEPKLQKYKIGLMLPLTGNRSTIGKSLKKAAELSFFENGEQSAQLLIKDTQGTPEGAKAAASALIKEGAAILLGPVFSEEVKAVSLISKASNLVVLSFSNDRAVASDKVFPLGFYPSDQIERVVEYCAKQSIRSLAALLPQNAYGDLLEKNLLKLQLEEDIKITAVKKYNPQGMNLNEKIKELDLTSTQALFVGEGEKILEPVVTYMKQKATLPSTVKIIGTSKLLSLSEAAKEDFQGAWFAAPDPAYRQDFDRRYQALYKQSPDSLATLAYDAVSLALNFGKRQQSAASQESFLLQPSGFEGTDGLFRLRRNGEVERSYAVLEVAPQGFKIKDPALSRF